MASITTYQAADGSKRYRVRYTKPDGTRTDKRGFTRKKDADLWLAGNTTTIAAGTWIDPLAGRVTFATVAEDWQSAQHNLAESTRSRYRGIVNQLTAQFGHLEVGKISRPLLREWLAEQVDQERPAETIHKTAGVLRRILALAVDDQRLAANPADGLKLPPVKPQEMRFLTLDELRQLAAAAGADAPAIWTFGVLGLRLGELVGLRWGDVDEIAGALHIVRSVTLVDGKHVTGPPKGGKRRDIPLVPFVVDQFGPRGLGDEPVFPAPNGGLIRHNNWRRRVFDPAIKAAKLAPLHPHELRHTAASLAISSGANVKAVQAMLGHSRASITLDRYGHLYPADLALVGEHLNTSLTNALGAMPDSA